MRNYTQFTAAKRLLANGYPIAYVATQVGAHRNTISAWARLLGYSAATQDKYKTQRVNAIFRKIQRLPRDEKTRLWRMLSRSVSRSQIPPSEQG